MQYFRFTGLLIDTSHLIYDNILFSLIHQSSKKYIQQERHKSSAFGTVLNAVEWLSPGSAESAASIMSSMTHFAFNYSSNSELQRASFGLKLISSILPILFFATLIKPALILDVLDTIVQTTVGIFEELSIACGFKQPESVPIAEEADSPTASEVILDCAVAPTGFHESNARVYMPGSYASRRTSTWGEWLFGSSATPDSTSALKGRQETPSW